MLRIDFVTLFPEFVLEAVRHSIMARAVAKNLVQFGTTNPRDFALDPHRTVDDKPYDGGPGMILLIETLAKAIRSVATPSSAVVLTDPSGTRYDQSLALSLAKFDRIVIVCGHYSGVDFRVQGLCTHIVSIGDFVLTGGELPAMMIADSVVRLHPQVLGDEASLSRDAHSNGLLASPQYTRPNTFEQFNVPEVLQSGDHQAASNWRRQQALRLTRARRPDLFARAPLQKSDLDLL